MKNPALSRARIAILALPALPVAMAHVPVGAIVPAFYAQHTASSITAIGTVFLVSRIFDAVIDPAIGHLSDTTRGRFGRRKPWVACGALLVIVAAWFLFNPPLTAGPGYLMLASMALYFGWGVLEIPYRAWSVELSRDYKVRSRISTMIAAMAALGTLIAMGVPMLPIFPTSEITPTTMAVMAAIIAILLPVTVGLALWRVPEGAHLGDERPSIGDGLRSLGRNRPFAVFALSFVFGGLGTGAFTAVFYLFVDSYLRIGESFALLYVVSSIANLVGMPLWYRVMQRFDRHRAYALSWAGLTLVQITMFAVSPGPGAYWPMVGFAAAFGLIEAAGKVAPYAILGDVVDYEAWRSGVDRSGSYFAVMILVAKINFAFGGGIAFLLLGLAGFQASGANSALATSGMLTVFIALPALLWLVAAFTILRFPLSRRRHEIVRRRLETRIQRTNPTD